MFTFLSPANATAKKYGGRVQQLVRKEIENKYADVSIYREALHMVNQSFRKQHTEYSLTYGDSHSYGQTSVYVS